jgi:hypothetical protein
MNKGPMHVPLLTIPPTILGPPLAQKEENDAPLELGRSQRNASNWPKRVYPSPIVMLGSLGSVMLGVTFRARPT